MHKSSKDILRKHHVFCSGMPRSGSTWSFNVCRYLLSINYGYPSVRSGYYGEDEALDDWYKKNKRFFTTKHYVIKFHYPGPRLLSAMQDNWIRNIYTVRDPRDACSSYSNFFETSFDQSIKAIRNSLYFYDKYKSLRNCIIIRYEDMLADPVGQIVRIRDFLGLPPGDDIVEAVFLKTSQTAVNIVSNAIPPGKDLDPLTQIHRHHIRSGSVGTWKDNITEEQEQLANNYFGEWLKDYL